MEPVINTEFVKPDAVLEEKVAVQAPEGKVLFRGKVDGYELDAELEAEILALPETKETKTVPLDADTGSLKVVDTFDLAKVVETGEYCKITAMQVRKVLHCSRARAYTVLEQLKKDGKLKTRDERYTELYPPAEQPEELADPLPAPEPAPAPAVPASQPLDDIGLSAVVVSALAAAGITTVDDLVVMTEAEVLAIAGIGPSYLENIKDALASLGKSLKA